MLIEKEDNCIGVVLGRQTLRSELRHSLIRPHLIGRPVQGSVSLVINRVDVNTFKDEEIHC